MWFSFIDNEKLYVWDSNELALLYKNEKSAYWLNCKCVDQENLEF